MKLQETLAPGYMKCFMHGLVKVATPDPPAPPPPPPAFTDEEEEEGRARRDAVMAAHEENHTSDLERARAFARELARSRNVTSDDVRAWADEVGVERGPWMGAVFRTQDFEHVGWTTSREPKQHARTLRVWALRTDN